MYGVNQGVAIVYLTEALAPSDTTPKTRNVLAVGYYYFNGAVWIRFVDVSRAPVTVSDFNGSGVSVGSMNSLL